MIITRQEVKAYAFCGQQLDEDGQPVFDHMGKPAGFQRCEGYKQVEVRAIRETVARTYGEYNSDSSDPMDQALAHNVETTTDRLVWADLDDRPCPHCGYDRDLSEQVRPQWATMAGSSGGPDVLFQARRAAREQGAAVVSQAEAMTRSAVAAEEANRLKLRELEIRERELEARQPTPVPGPRRRSAEKVEP